MYSNQKLYSVAGENYRVLASYCSVLDDEGYWKQPQEILNKSIHEMLDLYVQSLLVCCAVECKRLGKEERRFIAAATNVNRLGLETESEDDAAVCEMAMHIMNAPPILIQLCGLYDKEKHTGYTGLFFDALMNIMLAMAYLNGEQGSGVIAYIKDFYHKIEAFLYDRKASVLLDKKYLFRKICAGELEQSAKHILDVKGDFELYKKKYLYYREDVRQTEEVQIPLRASVTQSVEKPEAQPSQQQEAPKDSIEQLLQELNGLIGLKEVKSEINSLINLIKVRKLRERYALPDMEMSYHMVFSGSPGTGKTTVARLVAAIYKELGILSKGTLVETDRAGLVAGYVGQTALKVKEVVEKALGGVLFIDEAYTLSSSSAQNDFGPEALDTLVKMMEDYRDDLVVIVAGYTEEMKQFLKANTGLVSRFNKFIVFPDYSEEELLDIFRVMAEKAGFTVEEEAGRLLKKRLTDMNEYERKTFGNARGIRNLFEKIVVNQANRIVCYPEPSFEQLSTICAEDVG